VLPIEKSSRSRPFAGVLRPVIDTTFAFEQTPEAMAYLERGSAKAGKVVVAMQSGPDVASSGVASSGD